MRRRRPMKRTALFILFLAAAAAPVVRIRGSAEDSNRSDAVDLAERVRAAALAAAATADWQVLLLWHQLGRPENPVDGTVCVASDGRVFVSGSRTKDRDLKPTLLRTLDPADMAILHDMITEAERDASYFHWPSTSCMAGALKFSAFGKGPNGTNCRVSIDGDTAPAQARAREARLADLLDLDAAFVEHPFGVSR